MTSPKPFIGRPSQYDLKAIGKELVEWAQHPDSLKFTMFAAPRHINLQRFSEWADKDEDFAESLAIAKQFMDINRFKAAAQEIMPENWYSRNEGVYDPFHHEHYRKEKKFESDLRKQEEGAKPTNITVSVSRDLSAGINLSATPISVQDNTKPE